MSLNTVMYEVEAAFDQILLFFSDVLVCLLHVQILTTNPFVISNLVVSFLTFNFLLPVTTCACDTEYICGTLLEESIPKLFDVHSDRFISG